MRMKMAQFLRPFSTHELISHHFLSPLLSISPTFTSSSSPHRPLFVSLPSPHTTLDFQTRGLRLPQASLPIELEEENNSDSESSSEKSRNQKKREARRAVKWGMELAKFSTPQIKKILRIASLEKEVFDAIVLVKKFGPDVREGRRRQYNYIGRLLREVQPELMDTLIQASKDGDHGKIEELSATVAGSIEEVEEEEEEEESEYEEEEEEEECQNHNDVASRWSEGLILKDSDITQEVYSIHTVDFDRQGAAVVACLHILRQSCESSSRQGTSLQINPRDTNQSHRSYESLFEMYIPFKVSSPVRERKEQVMHWPVQRSLLSIFFVLLPSKCRLNTTKFYSF